jgi:hypothetical protein
MSDEAFNNLCTSGAHCCGQDIRAEARRARAAEERLTKALEEIIFGIERHDDTDGGWMPMNATEVVDIARRALRPTHNTAAESRKEER